MTLDPSHEISTNTRGGGRRLPGNWRWGVGVTFVVAATVATALGGITFSNDAYQNNLQMLRGQPARNTNHDGSAYRDVKVADLVQSDHLGPRSDYLGPGNGNPEPAFPTVGGGQFRTACEFSHFMFDDPILFPDQPGKSHLHMVFGNVDSNAYTTQETLEDSGSSTCNGQELNRSGYWVPAMIDGDGRVRIPERIVIYYKAEGRANRGDDPFHSDGTPNAGAQIYQRGMRNISPSNPTVAEVATANGGDTGEVNWKCSNNFSAFPFATGVATIPNCDGDHYANLGNPYPTTRTVLEMEVKFWNCFPAYDENNPNAASNPDITDWTLWQPTGPNRGSWFFSNCSGRSGGGGTLDNQETYIHFSYFVNYVVPPGDDTSDWFLAGDVDPATLTQTVPVLGPRGRTHHGDAWWSWHTPTLQQALDNCVNFSTRPTASGCGFGYLSNGGPNNSTPGTGPALKVRPQYDTPGDPVSYSVDGFALHAAICPSPAHTVTDARHVAWCNP